MSEQNKDTEDTGKKDVAGSDDGQVAIAKELNVVLQQISEKMERINKLTQSQSSLTMDMFQAFEQVQSNINNAAQSSNNISQNINELSANVINSFGRNTTDKIAKSLEQASEAAQEGIKTHTEGLSSLSENLIDTGSNSGRITSQMEKSSRKLSSSLDSAFGSVESFSKNVEDLRETTQEMSEAFKDLSQKLEELFGGFGAKAVAIGKGILSAGKAVINMVTSLIGAATKFFQFTLTLPFTITKAAVEIGNKIRTDMVEVIQSSAEELKESFDFDSYIGKGIRDMTSRGKGMLLAFQSPSSEMVKLFGYGAQGIANMIKEVGTNIAAMGHFSELFGRSIMGNGKRLKEFTKMVKGFGLSSEDIHYLALDAANNLEHINTRMARLGITLESVSKEFNIDRKRLSKNFMIMRKDITQFGHLSDEEIAKTTARLTQMRVKLEDAAAVFKKFSTFEDAANSVAILSQTFGMNLDAFDMIQAKNPEEIIDMFRNSMLETGRSFEDLNRFEKDLMAQHTGMSAESLAALMNYRDLGLTYEEARKKMAKETPEAKQMAALKKLNSAIKEVQKVLTFDSPFQAFADGLMANTTLSGDLRDTMISLSSGYQGIFEYAKNLDPDTWAGLARPIKLVIDIMRGIFKSEGFKTGLVDTVKVIGEFVGKMFGVTNPDRALTELDMQLKTASSRGKILDPKNKSKASKSFRKTLLRVLKDIKKEDIDAFSGFKGISIEDIKKITDPMQLIPILRKIQKEAGNNEKLQPYFESIMDNLTKKLGDLNNIESGEIGKEGEDTIAILLDGLKKIKQKNETNLGKVSSLSLRITGAVIKGAGTGLIALLKIVNGGIEEANKYLKKEGKDTNLIEKFLHFEPGEMARLGTELNGALSAFFNNSAGLTSLAGWLLDGFGDIFSVILDFFMGTLAKGMDSMFGTSFGKTGRVAMSSTRLSSRRTSSSAATTNVSKSITEKKDTDFNDVASLLNSLKDKIDTVEDENTSQQLKTAYDRLQKTFTTRGVTQDQAKNIGLEATGLLGGINESGEYTGDVSNLQSVGKRGLASAFGAGVHGTQGLSRFIFSLKQFDKDILKVIEGYKRRNPNNVHVKDIDIGTIPKIINDKNEISELFNNEQFISYWVRNKNTIETAMMLANSRLTKTGTISDSIWGTSKSKLEKDSYFETFKNLLHINSSLDPVEGQPYQEVDNSNPSPNPVVRTANDLSWLPKLSKIGTYDKMLENLMYSIDPMFVSDSSLEKDYITSHNPENFYNNISNVEINREVKGLSKQKVSEIYEKLCNVKEEIKDKKSEVNVEMKLDKDKVVELGIELAKNNLVGILSSPMCTEGVSYLLGSAIGSRCFNPGSKNSAASQSLIEGE